MCSTLREIVDPTDAAPLRKAHRWVETGHVCGKIVLESLAESPVYLV
jgi:hypothetical protein